MGLLEFIKTKPELRKIFGKRELKIIEKQLLGVNLTQSEKNRLSRDIRKKLNIIRELAKYEQEFELKKGTENKKLIIRIKNKILEDEISEKIKRIILFGSAADNELTLMSDIDIAVDFEDISDEESFKFRLRIGGYYSERADIQVYNKLPDKIKKQIDARGKILYQKNG